MEMNVIERTIFWLLLAIALGISGKRVYFLFRLIKMGKETREFGNLEKRIKTVLFYVLGQWSNLKNISTRDLAGFGHLFIFFGVIVFSINYTIFLFIGEGLGISETIRSNVFAHYFLCLSDITGLLLLIAIASAAVRRGILRPVRLGPNFDAGIFFALALFIFFLFACYFALEGLSLNLGTNVSRTPAAGAFADFFRRINLVDHTQVTLFKIIWWSQYGLILGFLIYAPYSHHQHPLFSPFNIYFRSFRPTGTIEPINFDKGKPLGVSRVEDFTWKQLLEGFACTHCGRCQDNCPAYLTEKPLSPKMVILDINRHLLDVGSRRHNTEQARSPVIPEEITKGILSCTTCGACVEVCPVFNRALDSIIELRRNFVYEGMYDQGHRVALQRTFDFSNPYAVTGSSRDTVLSILGIDKAIEGERYDVLYWLGCSAYFDERSQDIVRSVLKILKRAGLKVAALGVREHCCGDFVRRLGDEGLFQKLARENIETIKGTNFDILLTHCPHGYNTLKNEYPQFGADFRVIHHTEFIFNLLSKGEIQVDKAVEEIIYHDPCYLGRHNNVYHPPREVLNRLSGKLVEFPLCHNKSFCCGAGGGHMWKHEEPRTRINDKRMEQAIETGVKTVATSCPFCLAMLEDALLMKGLVAEMKIRDIAELVQEGLC
ncbi:MAG: (Fe-S)-binding protein [Desulfobacteraceae bacterium]|nr:(Fe-S)-binding protein [Desulfobacteraceae bacterium]